MLEEHRRKILIYQYQRPIIDIVYFEFFKSYYFQYVNRSPLVSPMKLLSQDSAGADNCPNVTWDSDENSSSVLVSLKV